MLPTDFARVPLPDPWREEDRGEAARAASSPQITQDNVTGCGQ
jgi:hypothetical protein